MRKKTGIAIALIISLALTGCGFFNNEEAVIPEPGSKLGAVLDDMKVIPRPSDVTVHEEVIEISGLKREFEIVFSADNHISLCDERDQAVASKAKKRYEEFKCQDGSYADESFKSVISYIDSEKPDLVIFGGDMVDSAMYAGIDFVTEQLSELKVPYLYGMGNHDFEYGDEYFSDRAFSEYLPRFASITDIEKGYQTIEYDELSVMIADDYNNKISADALEELRRICKKGKPVILSIHVPIEPATSNSLWDMSKMIWGYTPEGMSKVLLGNRSCIPDEVTAAFIDEITRDGSPVKVVMAGHIHFYHKDMLTENTVQLVAGPGFNKEVTKIILKPSDK